MTNCNKRLDEILSKTPCVQCDGSGAYPDYDGEPVQCQFCWQLRFTFIDKAKQAITSLIKELVADAKPRHLSDISGYHEDFTPEQLTRITAANRASNEAVKEFEQNLLKELEEV